MFTFLRVGPPRIGDRPLFLGRGQIQDWTDRTVLSAGRLFHLPRTRHHWCVFCAKKHPTEERVQIRTLPSIDEGELIRQQ